MKKTETIIVFILISVLTIGGTNATHLWTPTSIRRFPQSSKSRFLCSLANFQRTRISDQSSSELKTDPKSIHCIRKKYIEKRPPLQKNNLPIFKEDETYYSFSCLEEVSEETENERKKHKLLEIIEDIDMSNEERRFFTDKIDELSKHAPFKLKPYIESLLDMQRE